MFIQLDTHPSRSAGRSIRILLVATLALIGLTATSANASPREINQACATGPEGCFPGDAPGFPVEISEPGSYLLTSDLEVSDVNTHGIVFTTFVPSAKIDLGGHTLRGPVICTGTSVTLFCPPGNSIGIETTGWARRVEITRGRITGFPSGGLHANSFARISKLSITRNGATGMVVRGGSIVSDCVVENNAENGIAADRGIVSNVSAGSNYNIGIIADRSLIEDSTVRGNGGFGVLVDAYVMARGLSISDNSFGYGQRFATTLITDSTIRSNVNSGISLFEDASVQYTTIRGNGQYGLVGGEVSYRGLTLGNNSSGDLGLADPASFDLGENVCGGALCP